MMIGVTDLDSCTRGSTESSTKFIGCRSQHVQLLKVEYVVKLARLRSLVDGQRLVHYKSHVDAVHAGSRLRFQP